MTLSFRDVIKPEGSITPRDACQDRGIVGGQLGCAHQRSFHVIDAEGNLVCHHPCHGRAGIFCGREVDAFPWIAVMRIRATVAGQAKMAKALKQLLEGAWR